MTSCLFVMSSHHASANYDVMELRLTSVSRWEFIVPEGEKENGTGADSRVIDDVGVPHFCLNSLRFYRENVSVPLPSTVPNDRVNPSSNYR